MPKILALGYNYRTEVQCISPIANQIYCHFLLTRNLKLKENISYELPVSRLCGGGNFQEIISKIYSNVSESDLFKTWIEKQINIDTLSDAYNYYLCAKEAIERINPEKILLINTWTLKGGLARIAAQESNIPTIVVPSYFTQLSRASDQIISTFIKNSADSWVVMGPYLKEILLKNGQSPDKIYLSNLPIFEKKIDNSNLDSFEKRLQETGCNDFILFTLQDYPEENLLINDLIKAMDAFPNLALIIRPHPITKFKIGRLKKLRLLFKKRIIVENSFNLQMLLQRAKMLVTVTSLTAYEAILLNKPVLSLAYTSRISPYIFSNYGALIQVNSPGSIVDAVAEALVDRDELKESRAKFIKDFSPSENKSSLEYFREFLVD